MQIDLRRAAEKNAVCVDDIDLPIAFDFAKNLRGLARCVFDFVKGRPLRLVVAAFALVEVKFGPLPDVERIPIQDRL